MTLISFIEIISFEFIEHPIYSSPLTGASKVDAEDSDNDGDIDLLSGVMNDTGQKVTLFHKNLGGGLYAEPLTIHITASLSKLTNQIFFDYNGDDFPGVLIAEENSSAPLILYLNNGDGTFQTTPVVLDDNSEDVSAIYIADFDGDGKDDILYAYSGFNAQLRWVKNLGGGNFEPPSTLKFLSGDATEIKTGYIDGDSHLDVIMSLISESTKNISFFAGTGSSIGSAQVIVNDVRSLGIALGDFDNDGDIDLVYSEYFVHHVKWFSNDGTANFTNEGDIVDVVIDSPWAIKNIDFNKDGYEDIGFISSGNNTIFIVLNDENGTGNFIASPPLVVTQEKSGLVDIEFADINNDTEGIVDVVSLSSTSSEVAWYETTTTLGVEDNSLETQLILSPNPANNFVRLTNQTNIPLESLAIYDMNGRLVDIISLTNMQLEKQVDVSVLSSGIYLMKILGENASTIKRLIIK